MKPSSYLNVIWDGGPRNKTRMAVKTEEGIPRFSVKRVHMLTIEGVRLEWPVKNEGTLVVTFLYDSNFDPSHFSVKELL